MKQIVTESFTSDLYSAPSGQKNQKPTIFDELRWAKEHSQNPFEQIMQLICEFHGPWTGMNDNLKQLIDSSDQTIVTASMNALQLLKQVDSSSSTIGRINKITSNDMSVPLLREFIFRCQSIHPAINAFIQKNIKKLPYFQQISNTVGSLGKTKPSISEININDRGNSDAWFSLRESTSNLLFPPLNDMLENSNKMINVLYARSVMSIQSANDSTIAHGYNFVNDVENLQREEKPKRKILNKTIDKFGPALELCDNYFNTIYQIQNTPHFYNLNADGEKYVADRLNRPAIRDNINPVSSDDKKNALL
jgi:hypothetical protein